MFIRRKRFKNGKTQTQGKRKLNCCQRLMRKCRRCLCRKFKRCVKKKIFGVPDPHWSDYEIVGVSNVKSKFRMSKTKSLLTLFRKKFQNKESKLGLAAQNIDLIDSLSVADLKKKYSIKGSKEIVFRNMMNDYKTGKVPLSKLQTSKVNFDNLLNLEKTQVHELMKNYETALQDKYADLNAGDLKRKFSIKGSKEQILESFVEDIKKGKVTTAPELTSKSKFNPKKLQKDQFFSMLQKYEEEKNTKSRPSFLKQSKEKIRNIVEDIKNNDQLSALINNLKTFSVSLPKIKDRSKFQF